jgi:hypothetical protein
MNTQPPYGQPQGPYPPSGQYPYGPPPRRGPSTGVLVTILTAVVLVVAGGVVTTVLLLDSDDESASDEPDDTSASLSTDEATDDVTEDSTDDLTPAPSGDSVSGTGFSFALPTGWSDVSAEATQTVNPEVQAAAAAGSSLTQSPANVMVVVRPAEGATVPGELLPDWEAELESGTGMTAQFIPAPNVGGLETSSIQLEGVNSSGNQVMVVGYLTISNGQAYSILCTTSTSAEAESRAAFDEIIDSWQWA